MDEITKKLQQLEKSREISKLIYKQSNQKKMSLFIDDLLERY